MKRCSRCSAYSQDSYFVCARCGADLGPGAGDAGTYGQGFLALLGSRIGIRLLIMVAAALVFLGWFGFHAITH